MTVVLGVAVSGCVVAQAVPLADGIARVFLGGSTLTDIRGTIAVLGSLLLLRVALGYAQEVVAARAAASVKSELRRILLRRVVREEQAVPSGGLTQLATSGIDALDPYVARFLPQVVLACLVTPLFVAAIWLADWLSGLVVLLTVPIVMLFMMLIGSASDRLARRQLSQLQRLSHHFMDVVEGLGTLRVFGAAAARTRSVVAATDEWRRATMGVLRLSFLSAFVLELATSLSVALVAVQIGLRLLNGHIELEPALVVLLLAPDAYLPLRSLGANHHAAAEGLAVTTQILALVDPPSPQVGMRPAPQVAVHRIRVDLPSASFEVVRGEMVAIVGESGSGKSRLLSVLAGEHKPPAEGVWVGGVDLITIDPNSWRKQVAWLPQRPALLAGTVADNVRLGAPDATDAAVRRVLDLAAATDVDLEKVLREGGSGVSSGQRQRIGLARALLRASRGATLLLLDEPTAHLDGETESDVLTGLRELAPGLCLVFVTHRPALTAFADQVVHIAQPPVTMTVGL
jgi:thiol reductant ABC exporter CydD subunit